MPAAAAAAAAAAGWHRVSENTAALVHSTVCKLHSRTKPRAPVPRLRPGFVVSVRSLRRLPHPPQKQNLKMFCFKK